MPLDKAKRSKMSHWKNIENAARQKRYKDYSIWLVVRLVVQRNLLSASQKADISVILAYNFTSD